MGIWDAGTGKALRQFTNTGARRILSARFAPDARWLVLTVSEGREQLYPWERFAPTDDLIHWARTFVVRSDDRIRYRLD